LFYIEGASNNVLGITTIDKEDLSSTKNLQIGDRVIVQGTKFGMLKYIGKIHIDEGIWCGVKLDSPSGKHDGKVDGVRYFQCPHRFGLFAPLHHVEKILRDRTEARQSILSIDSNNDNLDSLSQDSNLSEFSVSSNNTNQFPLQSPKIIRQKSSTTDLTPMETSLSSQVAQLAEKIREKDLLIRKLEQQTEKDHLEDFQTKEKINEMEKHIIQLQQQYETTENENLNLIKEQFELKQRLDDLQDLDDDSLLSSDEIQLYEKTKEKVLELESINQKLIQEKQSNERQVNDLLNELKRYKENIVPDLEKQCQLLEFQSQNQSIFLFSSYSNFLSPIFPRSCPGVL
jgi:dynactin complex subunit